jgi:hypothetical protein
MKIQKFVRYDIFDINGKKLNKNKNLIEYNIEYYNSDEIYIRSLI